MPNKTIAILDLTNFQDQCLETLLFASILEKKYDTCAILDLNILSSNKIISTEIKKWAKSSGICKAKVFDNSLYHISDEVSLDLNKLSNLATSLQNSTDLLLINTNGSIFNLNSHYFDIADEVVIFADFSHDLAKNVLTFFLQQPIKNKKVYLVFYNFKDNIQSAKKYLNLLKNFKQQNIEMIKISSSPNVKTLKEIASVDPWLDIYKTINSKF